MVRCTMQRSCYRLIILLLVFVSVFIPPGSAADAAIGDQGFYVIQCEVYGANVYMDDKYVGTIGQGPLTVAAPTTGTPYKEIRVQKYGYSTFTDTITQVPVPGGTVYLYTPLVRLPETTPTSLGGDVGWFIVHGNIDGATVFFDDIKRGEIVKGVAYVPVYSTGTPYRSFTLKKEGYTPFTGVISRIPGKGETLDLFATLNPAPVTTPATPAPVGGDIGWYRIHSNVEGATVSFDNEPKGRIVNGTLSVQVYVTGTPFRTYMVYQDGYVPFSGLINKYPGKGETVDLYAMLNPQAGSVPATTQKSPVPAVLPAVSLVLGGFLAALGARKD